MNLKQLQYFVVSVDVGSISKAAELLYTTQPNVSKNIDRLEKEIGKILLVRKKSGVQLTKVGEELYKIARKVLSDAEEIQKFSELRKREVLAVASMPSRITATLFAEYYQHMADKIEMKFIEGPLEMVLKNITHHHAPIGFIYISELQMEALKNEMDIKRLEFHGICDAEFRLHVGPLNPYYNKTHISMEELSEIKLIQNQEERIPLLDYPGHLNNQGMRKNMLHKVVEVNSDHAMIQMLLQTDLGNISNHISAELSAANGVHSLIIENHKVKACYGYVMKKGNVMSEMEEDFLNYIIEHIRSTMNDSVVCNKKE